VPGYDRIVPPGHFKQKLGKRREEKRREEKRRELEN
jgi:hypothetical protein